MPFLNAFNKRSLPLPSVLGGAGRHLENRARWPGILAPVRASPPQQGVHLGRDVTVGTRGLVELGLVIDSWHPTMMPER